MTNLLITDYIDLFFILFLNRVFSDYIKLETRVSFTRFTESTDLNYVNIRPLCNKVPRWYVTIAICGPAGPNGHIIIALVSYLTDFLLTMSFPGR